MLDASRRLSGPFANEIAERLRISEAERCTGFLQPAALKLRRDSRGYSLPKTESSRIALSFAANQY